MNSKLEEAITLRQDRKYEESRKMLLELVEEHPNDALINYHCGWVHDNLGLEIEAAPYYERAIHLGLADSDLEGAYTALGSTYRTIGEYEKSYTTLVNGLKLFPESRSMKVFLALTQYNLGKHHDAMEALLLLLIETTEDKSIKHYERALRFYSDKLDQVWT